MVFPILEKQVGLLSRESRSMFPTLDIISHSPSLAEHAEKSKHHVCIEESKVIARVDHFHHNKLTEAIEIDRHAINTNRDDGWKLNKS